PALAELANDIHRWISPLVDEVTWGQTWGRMVPTISQGGARHQLFVIRADGNTAVRFAYLRVKPPFNSESVMYELLRKMNEIPGLSFAQDAVGKKPAFPLELLAAPGALEKFKAAIEWMIERIRAQR